LSLGTAAGLVPAAAGRIAALVIASAELGGSVLPWLQGRLLELGASWGVILTLIVCLAMAVLQLSLLTYAAGTIVSPHARRR